MWDMKNRKQPRNKTRRNSWTQTIVQWLLEGKGGVGEWGGDRKYVAMEGELTQDGERTVQHTDDIELYT